MLKDSELRWLDRQGQPMWRGLVNCPERDKDLLEAIELGMVRQSGSAGFILTQKGKRYVKTISAMCTTCGQPLPEASQN